MYCFWLIYHTLFHLNPPDWLVIAWGAIRSQGLALGLSLVRTRFMQCNYMVALVCKLRNTFSDWDRNALSDNMGTNFPLLWEQMIGYLFDMITQHWCKYWWNDIHKIRFSVELEKIPQEAEHYTKKNILDSIVDKLTPRIDIVKIEQLSFLEGILEIVWVLWNCWIVKILIQKDQ